MRRVRLLPPNRRDYPCGAHASPKASCETLKELIRIQGEVGADLEGALEALELARWDDLPEAELPWTLVADRLSFRGSAKPT